MSDHECTVEAWLAALPNDVKKPAERFPPGSTFNTDQGKAWLMGYCQDGGLLLTYVNPNEIEL